MINIIPPLHSNCHTNPNPKPNNDTNPPVSLVSDTIARQQNPASSSMQGQAEDSSSTPTPTALDNFTTSEKDANVNMSVSLILSVIAPESSRT
jgi:hypothetical protein